ncbi:hypothetical protein ACFLS1_01450 [Verrucomicrobiota bacterium]
MKSVFAIVAIAACLIGCAKQTPVDSAAPPVMTTSVTGYSSEGNFLTLLNGDTPISSLPLPNDADKKYVTLVSEHIQKAVVAFISQPETEFTVVAARTYGRILLLDVEPKGWDDGNIHIVYDLKREAVVGRFVWYTQG